MIRILTRATLDNGDTMLVLVMSSEEVEPTKAFIQVRNDIERQAEHNKRRFVDVQAERRRRIGVAPPTERGKGGKVLVRGHWHLSECLVVLSPEDHPDEDCTCHDWSPD